MDESINPGDQPGFYFRKTGAHALIDPVQSESREAERALLNELRICQTNEPHDTLTFTQGVLTNFDEWLENMRKICGQFLRVPCRYMWRSGMKSFEWGLPSWFLPQNFHTVGTWILSHVEKVLWARYSQYRETTGHKLKPSSRASMPGMAMRGHSLTSTTTSSVGKAGANTTANKTEPAASNEQEMFSDKYIDLKDSFVSYWKSLRDNEKKSIVGSVEQIVNETKFEEPPILVGLSEANPSLKARKIKEIQVWINEQERIIDFSFESPLERVDSAWEDVATEIKARIANAYSSRIQNDLIEVEEAEKRQMMQSSKSKSRKAKKKKEKAAAKKAAAAGPLLLPPLWLQTTVQQNRLISNFNPRRYE